MRMWFTEILKLQILKSNVDVEQQREVAWVSVDQPTEQQDYAMLFTMPIKKQTND